MYWLRISFYVSTCSMKSCRRIIRSRKHLTHFAIYVAGYTSIIFVLATSALCYVSGLVPQPEIYKTAHTARAPPCPDFNIFTLFTAFGGQRGQGAGRELPPPGDIPPPAPPKGMRTPRRAAGGCSLSPSLSPFPVRSPQPLGAFWGRPAAAPRVGAGSGGGGGAGLRHPQRRSGSGNGGFSASFSPMPGACRRLRRDWGAMGPLRESSKVRRRGWRGGCGDPWGAGAGEPRSPPPAPPSRRGRGGGGGEPGFACPCGMVEGEGHIPGVPDSGVSPPEQEQKAQLEKEVSSRSRIPRLVLRPQQKVSPASESPFSEEESREFNPPSSSGGSGRTVSSNSFCSGTADTPHLPPHPPRLGPQPGGSPRLCCHPQTQHPCVGLLSSLPSIPLCRWRRATIDFSRETQYLFF